MCGSVYCGSVYLKVCEFDFVCNVQVKGYEFDMACLLRWHDLLGICFNELYLAM